MIKKSFELNNKIIKENNIFLFYGANEEAKKETLEKITTTFDNKNFHKYDEKEVLYDQENFLSHIINKSLFEEKKVIIINRATDKILEIIQKYEGLIDSETKVILKSEILEKKSKLRKYFESEKKLICIAFYQDDSRNLLMYAQRFLKENNILVSTYDLNLIINKCNGDRSNLKNELVKLKYFASNSNKIKTSDIIKLVNLIENFSIDQLNNNYLAKDKNKILQILNENNYLPEDCIQVIKNLLFKSKKLLNLVINFSQSKNINYTIQNSRPPIFWKEKEIISKQILKWSQNDIKKLIYRLSEIELELKKNYNNSVNILTDFILEDFSTVNNNS